VLVGTVSSSEATFRYVSCCPSSNAGPFTGMSMTTQVYEPWCAERHSNYSAPSFLAASERFWFRLGRRLGAEQEYKLTVSETLFQNTAIYQSSTHSVQQVYPFGYSAIVVGTD
jgi:hypothetical protein